MRTQPEALRLAEFYEGLAETPPKSPDNSNIRAAAAELRRLHAENEAMRNVANRGGHIAVAMSRIADLESQRDVLLEALKEMLEYSGLIEERCDTVTTNKARAAIEAVEETK